MTSPVPPAALFFRNSRRSITSEVDMCAPPGNSSQNVRAREMAGLREIFGSNGKSPDTLAGCGENRIAHGRSQHGQSGLADSGGLFLAHNNVDFRFWFVAHSRHLVIVQIPLPHAPIL